MAVTQQQIADKLQVSRSLVARALSGHSEVAESTRLLIEATARELSYNANSNHGARQLAAQRYGKQLKTNTVAVIFPPMEVSPRRGPFFTPIIEGMEIEAENLGLDLGVFLMRSDKLPRLIETHSVDGVVVLGGPLLRTTSMGALGMPVVTFQFNNEHVHRVIVDDQQGIYQATRHLIELGHRKIAFLGVTIPDSGTQHLSGYRDAMRDAGLRVKSTWVSTHLHLPISTPSAYCIGCGVCGGCNGWQWVREHCPEVTAVVCYNDPIAMGVIEHAQRDGVQVPRDLSVTGFDDVSLDYRFEPAITSLRFPRTEMGAAAIRLLHRAIESERTLKPQHEIFSTELMIRQSTAPPRNVIPRR